MDDSCGIYLIEEKDVDRYLSKYNPVQLRYFKKTKVNEKFRYMNYGESKGTEYDRVLIYPTDKIWKWILEPDNVKNELPTKSKAAFYVAITRARHSVCIVRKNKKESKILKDFKIDDFID